MQLSRLRTRLAEIAELLAPQQGRFAYSARLALICALTVLVAEIYQTPEPALAAYVVFFLNHDDRATSLIMNIALMVVMTVIIGFVLIVAMVVADYPMWRFISHCHSVVRFFVFDFSHQAAPARWHRSR